MPRIYSISLGGGGQIDGRADTVAIADGAQTVSVVFSSDLGNDTYALNVTIQNFVDGLPIYLTAVIKNKTVSGFDVELSAPTDSANYVLNYAALSAV